MIQFLKEWIKMRGGAAPVSILPVGQKSHAKMVLYAVDEVGILIGDRRIPEARRAVPWSAITLVEADRSE